MDDFVREIAGDDQLRASAAVVRESFATVAQEFGLTEENCPTHPSFVTLDQLKGLQGKGLRLFGLFEDGVQVGFVAVERGEGAACYMEKLAVLPRCRHRGYGSRLVRFAIDHAVRQGADKLSIGTIDRHTVLKDWYKRLGFAETGTREFSHLPFTVCFMEVDLSCERDAMTSCNKEYEGGVQ